MSKRHFLVSTLTTIAVCGALFRFTDLSVAQNPPATTTAAPQPFNPSFGDLMNLLVQPRHIKLAFAGREANWPNCGLPTSGSALMKSLPS